MNTLENLVIPSHNEVARGYSVCPVRKYVRTNFVIALAPTFIDGFWYNFKTNVGYDNTSSKFDFQGPVLKVKVTVAIFRKTLSSL